MAQSSPSTTAPQSKGTNGFAIASLIMGFLPGLSLLAIIFRFVALSQIKEKGEEGKGLAIAGIILGFVWIIIAIIWILFAFVFVTSITQSIIQTPGVYNQVFNELNSTGNFQFELQ